MAKLTQKQNREAPFELCFKYPLENGYTFKELTPENIRQFQAFLNKVAPTYAVISVGEYKNKLPKKEILDRLEKNNIKVYRTDWLGTVIFATNGEDLKVFCEKESA